MSANMKQAKRYRNASITDLIEGAWRLLNRSEPSWVLYKLDSQIDHILLDEAQIRARAMGNTHRHRAGILRGPRRAPRCA